MSLRRISVLALAGLAFTVVGFMCYLAFLAFSLGEQIGAAGWLTSGFLTLREFMSKIENVALNIRSSGDLDTEIVETVPPLLLTDQNEVKP